MADPPNANESSPAAHQTSQPEASPGTRLRQSAMRVAGPVLVFYLVMCAAVFAFQRKLIYVPDKAYAATPADMGLSFAPVTLQSGDGIAITAWHVSHAASRGTVIFCHGNAGNLSNRLVTIRELHRLRMSTLIFDYRGYGTSEGSPSEAGCYEDAESAWHYLTENLGEPPNRIVWMGESLGGAVAIEMATRHEPAALVVESTFTSMADVGARQYPFLPVRWLCIDRFESINKIGRVTCPKLQFHGIDDELVPIDQGRRLFDAAALPKQFIETPGGHNNGGFTYSEKYVSLLGEFFDGVLAK